jgi:HAD superfamily hydrolase (TIGR01450 family)
VLTWALDLDGVLWTGATAIPGSAEAVNDLRAAGYEVVFVTNNAANTIAEQETKLGDFGVDAANRVINAAQAGAALVSEGERVYVLGGPGVIEAVEARGGVVVSDSDCDVVVVGLDRDLSYGRLSNAVLGINSGARFVATNTDSSFPHERGLLPGGGALVAAVQTATGVEPVIGGKPHQPMADLVRSRFGTNGIMVGDRPETDGLFASSLGYDFGLVLTGVTRPGDLPTEPPADVVAPDLATMVADYLSAT